MNNIDVYIYNQNDYSEYKDYFGNHPVLKIKYGNIFNGTADVLVTAGQSYGMMDGGIDAHVNYFFNYIENRVQNIIMEKWNGELPVGTSIVLEAASQQFKYLCYAPTMRVPMCVEDSINAYLAMRGALVECSKYPKIKTMAVPMLCRGVGRMSCEDILKQIKHAYDTFTNPTKRNWSDITKEAMVLGQEPGM